MARMEKGVNEHRGGGFNMDGFLLELIIADKTYLA